MAYVKPTSEYFDTEKKEVIDRLLKFKEPFVFDGETSLDALSKDLDKVKATIKAECDAYDMWIQSIVDRKAATTNYEDTKTRMRTYVSAGKNMKESNEFVILGGTRPSETAAAQAKTREDKKKAAEEKKKADAALKKEDGEKDKPQ